MSGPFSPCSTINLYMAHKRALFLLPTSAHHLLLSISFGNTHSERLLQRCITPTRVNGPSCCLLAIVVICLYPCHVACDGLSCVSTRRLHLCRPRCNRSCLEDWFVIVLCLFMFHLERLALDKLVVVFYFYFPRQDTMYKEVFVLVGRGVYRRGGW